VIDFTCYTIHGVHTRSCISEIRSRRISLCSRDELCVQRDEKRTRAHSPAAGGGARVLHSPAAALYSATRQKHTPPAVDARGPTSLGRESRVQDTNAGFFVTKLLILIT
jgi:hypothetical protein